LPVGYQGPRVGQPEKWELAGPANQQRAEALSQTSGTGRGISISPAADLTLASKSLKTVHDPIISSKTMPIFRDHYLGEQNPANPLASPVFGDYRGLPPLLIQAGEHEMLRDDSVRTADKAKADGVDAKLEIWPGMFHVFQSHDPLLPEGKEAIDHIAQFVQSLTPAK
jgi:monoterpene epsilon-lactone hydrolase